MYRIGQAQDIHRLVVRRKLILGGIEIPFEKGLLGHSDADVVIHAFGEAILGALALGDLGKHFPDSDASYKDIDSKILLNKIIDMMMKLGYEIGNADISIILEKPKLGPHLQAMREVLADISHASIDQFSIKAGTNEGQDAIGRGEACLATCIVLLRKREK